MTHNRRKEKIIIIKVYMELNENWPGETEVLGGNTMTNPT
jgi:hypothetical protein